VDRKEIINRIDTEGFAVIENFISPETLDKFMPEVYRRFDRLSYNGTKGYVRVPGQKYLQDTLTIHEEILKIYFQDIPRKSPMTKRKGAALMKRLQLFTFPTMLV
jgi:hypothetical protein